MATCSRSRSTPRAPRRRWAKSHWRWSGSSAGTAPRSGRSRASTSGRSAPCRKRLRGCRSSSLSSKPMKAARQAVENDVHVLGVSSLAAAHLTLVPQLKAALVKEGRDDIMIVVGGVVPPQDHDALKRAGAEAIFPPGTVIAEAAEALIHKLNQRLGHGQQAAE